MKLEKGGHQLADPREHDQLEKKKLEEQQWY